MIDMYKMSFSNLKLFVYYSVLLCSIFLISFIISNFDDISYRVLHSVTRMGATVDIYYTWLLGLFCFLVLTLIVSLFNNKDYLKLWLIKAFITLIFMLIYEYKYGLDSYMYYANAVYSEGMDIFGYAATDRVIIFTRILSDFVGDSYYSIKLIYSFIGFLGLILFYKSYLYVMKNNQVESHMQRQFMYMLFLLPSILFWSSTLGKDSLTLFIVGLFVFNFIKLIDSYKLTNIVFLLVAMYLAYLVRPWFLIIFTMTIFFFYLNFKSRKQIIFSIVLSPILYYMVWEFLASRSVHSVDKIFETIYISASNMSEGGSAIEVNDISTLVGYIYYYIPNIFTSIFRPMFYDVTNVFTLLNAVENIILLYLVITYILLRPLEIWNNKYLKALILFILTWSLIYVIISPTNLGIAVRFKLQVLPVILIIIFISRSIIFKEEKHIKCTKQ
mgnify:CR=1 FL=1